MRELRKILAPLSKRIALMVSRAVVSLVKDSFAMQGLQVQALADEVLDVERFQNYGFTSVPLAGAEAIVLSLGGHRDHAIAIAVDDRRYRKKNLASGEVALYTDEGDYILFKRGRTIEVVAGTKVKVTAPEVEVIASTKVRLATPLVEITAALTVAGLITGQAGIVLTGGTATHDGVNIGKTHVHGGVQSGPNTTGVPQ